MDTLYIRIPTINGLWQGWLLANNSTQAKVLSQHELEAIMAAKAANMRIHLLLPTSACVIAPVNITKQQLKQLSENDIAYLLEDQVLTSVEQLSHFIWLTRSAESQLGHTIGSFIFMKFLYYKCNLNFNKIKNIFNKIKN